MAEHSVARSAPSTTPAERANEILDRIEAEIDRLKRRRPRLEPAIQKAANIIVAHLAGRPAMRVVRVRISKTGKPRFLFASLTGNGATYVVDAQSWSCSCPAAHRYGMPCKHGLAAYLLWRASQPAERKPACPACQDGLIRRTQEYVNEATGELVERTTSLPCRACSGRGVA